MTGWIDDLRVAVRGLLRRPLFTAVAAGSLAVGIGANTAVFTVASSLLLRPMPAIQNPDRVVEIGSGNRGQGFGTFSYPDFLDIRDQVGALDEVAAWSMQPVSVARGEEGIRAQAYLVSPSYFRVLGLPEGRGRYFTPDEDRGPGTAPVVVLSHGFWQDRLGAEPDILGSTLMVNRTPYTVVGITPREFRGHMTGLVPELFVPMVQQPALTGSDSMESRGAFWHQVLGRLAPGATLEGLNRELDALASLLAQVHPRTNGDRTFRALPAGPIPAGVRSSVRLFFGALLGMVGLVLLVTCANVAGMFVARSLAREKEVAVRQALGAGRARVIRLLTVEALVVFALGGGLGAWAGIELLGLLRVDRLPLPELVRLDLTPDYRVLLFAMAVTLGTGLLFGLLPAVQATRLDLVRSIKGAGGTGRVGSLRKLFAASQVGLSLVVVVSAGLFLRSVLEVGEMDTGFEARGVYTTSLDLAREGYEPAEGLAFQDQLARRLAGLPWVESVALSQDLPMDMTSHGTAVIPEGRDPTDMGSGIGVGLNRVSTDYFETLKIATLGGRVFQDGDRGEAERVAVVTRPFVEAAFPEGDALGKTLQLTAGQDAPRYRIVGVVDDTPNTFITDDPGPFVYLPLAQDYWSQVRISVRSDAPAPVALAGLREAILEADPSLSLAPVLELDGLTRAGLLPHRVTAWLTASLAFVALLLSAMGIYGVIASAVGSQRREIGIRMALGASAPSVVRRYLWRGVGLALPGLALGFGLSLALTRVMGSFLLGLSPWDPTALGAAVGVLGSVVALAAWIPARRAARVEPAVSLRGE